MSSTSLANKRIALLRDVAGVTPVERDQYGKWAIHAISTDRHEIPENYLSPHRQDFYKVMLIVKADIIFTIGMRMFHIDGPAIIFIPPDAIISCKNMSGHSLAHHCLFKKHFAEEHPVLKAAMTRYRLFSENDKNVIRLTGQELSILTPMFLQLQETEATGGPFADDTMQTHLQLILIESTKIGNYAKPDDISEDYKHIHDFFDLLKKETSTINYTSPVRIKTAKEFADQLALTPNYLNALLKKHTGQNVSAHIKLRLLDESKALLVQTDWTLQDIGYSIGFSDQPNFSSFFKKLAGVTPAEFRRQHR